MSLFFSSNEMWFLVSYLPTFSDNVTLFTVFFLKSSLRNIKSNSQILAEKLEIKTTATTPIANVSVETLQTAAKIFTYLNYCPTKITLFFRHLLGNASPKEIILALSSIKHTSINAEKISAEQIFTKTMDKLSLNNFENTQVISQGKCYNKASFGKCRKKVDVANKQDLKVLGSFL